MTTFTVSELADMGYTVDQATGRAVRASALGTPEEQESATGTSRHSLCATRPLNWREKDEQRECYKLLRACGWRVWWLSQARRSGQTKGIPDLLARHLAKSLILWVEVKNPDAPAEWTEEQQDFARCCIEGKETYIIGGEGKLRAWLSNQGWDV